MAGLIVHEWLERTGGSEQVVKEMRATFPEADLFVLWDDSSGLYGEALESWLAHTPLRRHKALALFPQLLAWRYIKTPRQYDWTLVSSHLFAHHVRHARGPQPRKYVYAHTPARYIWEPELDTRGSGLLARTAAAGLKPIDRVRAAEAYSVAANSSFTAARVSRAWDREARVIYPPVQTEIISSQPSWAAQLVSGDAAAFSHLPANYLLGASRFVEYKRLDLVIAAGEALGLPVVLAGDGPLWAELSARADAATVPVRLIRRPSHELLYALYERCEAYIFPAIEDFGIMPVEAMAAGAPVIAGPTGGVVETVSLSGGGTTVESFEASEWRAAFERAQGLNRDAVRAGAQRFSTSRFHSELRDWLSE